MDTVCIRGSFPQGGIREIILRSSTFTAFFPVGHDKDGRMCLGLPAAVRASAGHRAPSRTLRRGTGVGGAGWAFRGRAGSAAAGRDRCSGEPSADRGRVSPSDTLIARRRNGYIAQSGH